MDSQVVQPIKCILCGQQCASLEEHKTTCLPLWIARSDAAEEAKQAFTAATGAAMIARDVFKSAILVNQECERVLTHFMEVVKKAARVSDDALQTGTYSAQIVSLAEKSVNAVVRAIETNSNGQNKLPGDPGANEGWMAAIEEAVCVADMISNLVITANTYNSEAATLSTMEADKPACVSAIVLRTMAPASWVTSLAAKAAQIAAAVAAKSQFKAYQNLPSHDAVEEQIEENAKKKLRRAEELTVGAVLAEYTASLLSNTE